MPTKKEKSFKLNEWEAQNMVNRIAQTKIFYIFMECFYFTLLF